MAQPEIGILSMLRTRMQWHQERQRVLADNVANSDTPDFRPRDLVEPKFDQLMATPPAVGLVRTDPGHQAAADGVETFPTTTSGFEIRPRGNAVNLEEEMMKVADNQMDFQTVSSLYGKSLGLIKLAVK
jgi:flagellar basal-body rod protein FlgB